MIKPADLVYTDNKDVLSILPNAALRIPGCGGRDHPERHKIMPLCASPEFSIAELKELTKTFGYAVSKSGMYLKEQGTDEAD